MDRTLKMMRLHKTDGSKPVNVSYSSMRQIKALCEERATLIDECVQSQADLNRAMRKIQSLEAQLKNARDKNRKQNLLLGKAQKRASKVCAVQLANKNKHLMEQFKKVTKRYKELKSKNDR